MVLIRGESTVVEVVAVMAGHAVESIHLRSMVRAAVAAVGFGDVAAAVVVVGAAVVVRCLAR